MFRNVFKKGTAPASHQATEAMPGDTTTSSDLPHAPQSSPTESVRDAIAQGISSRSTIAQRTGLRRETVDLIIDRLERSGSLRRESLGGMCAGGGCSSCQHKSGGGCWGADPKFGPCCVSADSTSAGLACG